MTSHRRYAVIIAVLCSLLVVTCGASNGQETRDTQIIDRQQLIYANTQPINTYDWSQARQSMLNVLDARVRGISTTSLLMSFDGKVLYVCPSRGFPIPGGAELTNPWRFATTGSYQAAAIGQADPHGIFDPPTSAGTYVACVRPDGKVGQVYWEPPVGTFSWGVHYDQASGKIVDDANATVANPIDMSHPVNVVSDSGAPAPGVTPSPTRKAMTPTEALFLAIGLRR